MVEGCGFRIEGLGLRVEGWRYIAGGFSKWGQLWIHRDCCGSAGVPAAVSLGCLVLRVGK